MKLVAQIGKNYYIMDVMKKNVGTEKLWCLGNASS